MTEKTEKKTRKKKSTLIHLAGAFYQSRNGDGEYFMGTKEKAELFEAGKYTPNYRHVVADGALIDTAA